MMLDRVVVVTTAWACPEWVQLLALVVLLGRVRRAAALTMTVCFAQPYLLPAVSCRVASVTPALELIVVS